MFSFDKRCGFLDFSKKTTRMKSFQVEGRPGVRLGFGLVFEARFWDILGEEIRFW